MTYEIDLKPKLIKRYRKDITVIQEKNTQQEYIAICNNLVSNIGAPKSDKNHYNSLNPILTLTH